MAWPGVESRSPCRQRSRPVVLLATLALAIWAHRRRASPTPFGIPTTARPQPAADIDAVPGSRAQGWLAQGRSEVIARHGIVATSDPLASEAGLEILRRGGNAIDAAVATGAVLDVTSQNDTGIGGDLFALVYVAKDQKLYALNSGGWAPAGWTPEFFTKTLGVKELPQQRRERGDGARRDLRLRRAAHALRDADLQGDVRARRADRRRRLGPGGTPSRRICASAVSGLRADPDSKADVPRSATRRRALYSIIRNPGLAKALRLLQQQGRDAFYTGDIAEAIVAKVKASGGVMTRADLAEFQSEWVEPISTNYHGYDVFELPPPGQGFAALEMLNILEVCVPKLGFNLAALGPSNPMYWHLLVEAKKLAYADLQAKNGDPKFAHGSGRGADLEGARRGAVRPDQSGQARRKPRVPAAPTAAPIYLTTADRWGNMVSLIHSVFSVYGSRATVPVRLRPAQPRHGVLARPGEPQRRRAAQAAVPLDHRRLRDEGRRSR